ncbi:hypothetical protein GYMLUDRAFT_32394 [Collybiopsis luxurians FD-317 M1]|nr:hypothetical protein GYMLUDRAFT_32394 [Collybiopsis luxurians FD-317 M1]
MALSGPADGNTLIVDDGGKSGFDSTRAQDLQSQKKRSSYSAERRPDSIGITPDMKIIDLTQTPTDTSPQEEIQGFSIHDLDDQVPLPPQTNLGDLTANSTPFPVITSEQVPPTLPMIITTNRSIRFRSRVRITSGVHHARRNRSLSDSIAPNGPAEPSEGDTAVSSRSSSPSSSISVPIRFREDEPTSPKWGPLGQRVRLFVSQQREKAKQLQEDRVSRGRRYGTEAQEASRLRREDPSRRVHEGSPLLGAHGRRQRKSLYRHEDEDDGYPETRGDYQARLNHEIDLVFGKWPGRLLNHHWWWWQIRPVICCNFDDWEGES